jgi:hypothetical protein
MRTLVSVVVAAGILPVFIASRQYPVTQPEARAGHSVRASARYYGTAAYANEAAMPEAAEPEPALTSEPDDFRSYVLLSRETFRPPLGPATIVAEYISVL